MKSLNNKKLITLDILKLNHWLNARKITLSFIRKRIKSLYIKLKDKKNFNVSQKEINFINSKLLIPTEKIVLKKKLPDYILMKNRN